MSLMFARIEMTCERCNTTVVASSDIRDDGHNRGVCRVCLAELELKRGQKLLAHNNPKCSECGKIKPRECFSAYHLQRWDSLRRDRLVFGVRFIHTPEITCLTCKTLENQKRVADKAVGDLRRKSVRWWKRGTKLTEKNLTEELIETKTVQMKVKNLWQTPQI